MRLCRQTPVILAAILLCGTGCDQRRLQQFSALASAGTEYTRSFSTLTSAAGQAFVAADSQVLVAARELAGDQVVTRRDAFRKDLLTQDAAMRQYLRNLQMLDQHAALLGTWFAALGALADGKQTTATVQALDATLDALNGLDPRIESIKLGSQPLKDVVTSAGNLVVAHVQERALDRELHRSAPVIDRALALQEAAVTTIVEQMGAALPAASTGQENSIVVHPFLAAGDLPADWAASRASTLEGSVRLEEIGPSALAAIRALHAAFRQLAGNPYGTIHLAPLPQTAGPVSGAALAAVPGTGQQTSK